jgi:small-conductance mechanosensitive channel
VDVTEFTAGVSRTLTEIWNALDYLKLLRIALLLAAVGLGLRLLRSVVLRLATGRVSEQTQMLLKKAFGWITLVVLVVLFFGALGFDISAVLGAAGIAGIALGFAAQTSISNVISGLFLLSEKPFAVGDIINTGGVSGVVLSIDTLSVKVRTFDNTFVRIPNETLIKSNLINVTRYPIRRLDILLTIPYSEDLSTVMEVIKNAVLANKYALANPEYFLMVKRLAPLGVEISLGVWFERSDMTELKNSLVIELLQCFRTENIKLPQPWMYFGEP